MGRTRGGRRGGRAALFLLGGLGLLGLPRVAGATPPTPTAHGATAATLTVARPAPPPVMQPAPRRPSATARPPRSPALHTENAAASRAGRSLHVAPPTGQRLVAQLAQHAATTFASTGHESPAALLQAVRRLGPAGERSANLVALDENLEFAMNHFEQRRDGIAEHGFRNLFETGKSGLGAQLWREETEAQLLGMSREDYAKVPHADRAKYGFLRPSATSGVSYRNLDAYGNDTFVFKKAAVRERITFWLGDSAMASQFKTFLPAWTHVAQPWSNRALLAPHASVEDDARLTFQRLRGFEGPDLNPPFVELQFWGPLGLADVERFEFSETPPSGAFLQALRENGVKIFRRGTADEWR